MSISFFPGIAGATTASGVTVTPQTALQLSAVYTCVHMISTDIAKLPVFIQKEDDGGWKKDKKNPINTILRKPNENDTLYTMLQALVFNFLISGNGYVALIRNRDGSVKKMIPCDNWAVTVNQQVDGTILYYANNKLFMNERTSFRKETGQQRTFRNEDMIHIQNFNLAGSVYGTSPIQSAGEVFGLGLSAQEAAARAFNNGSYFQGFLKATGAQSKQKLDQMKDAWSRVQQSVTNFGSTPILPHDVDFINTRVSPQDLQLIEAREQVTKDIARMYKVPLHRLGFGDSEKAANMEQQERAYISSALEPITEQLVQQMNLKMLFDEEYDDFRLHFDFTQMLMPDMLQRYQAHAIALTNGFMNRNEVRSLEDLPPLPDDEGNVFLIKKVPPLPHLLRGRVCIQGPSRVVARPIRPIRPTRPPRQPRQIKT